MPDPLTDDHLGPVDYLAVEFPHGRVGGEGFDHLLARVAEGNVLVLDLELVQRQTDGWRKVSAASVDTDVDLTAFEGADSSLLDMHAALRAWSADGARLVAQGSLTIDDLAGVLGDDKPADDGQ